MSSRRSPGRTCQGSNVPLEAGRRTELSALIKPFLALSLRTSTSSPGSPSRSRPEVTVCKSEDSVEAIPSARGAQPQVTWSITSSGNSIRPPVIQFSQELDSEGAEASSTMDPPPPSFPEYDGRHPLISLLSACFWVFCTRLSSRRVLYCANALSCRSMDAVVGEVSHCVCDHHSSEAHLFCALVVDDIDGGIAAHCPWLNTDTPT